MGHICFVSTEDMVTPFLHWHTYTPNLQTKNRTLLITTCCAIYTVKDINR